MARAITIQFLGDVKDLVKAAGQAEASAGGVGAKFKNAGKVAAVGFAAIAGAAVVGGKALYEVGETFDNVADTIRVGTGATGENLDALVDSAKRVGTQVPASFEDVGATIADLNTRLGLTGPVLEELSAQFLEAGRITGEALDVNTVTGAFSAFNVEGEKASDALDTFYRVSQATGISMNELATSVEKNAPNLTQFGFSIEDAAALLGTLDKAGLDGDKTLATLSRAMVGFAEDGREPKKALEETVASIEEFTKTGQDAKAINLAADIFGTRGASQFVAAIKSGKVNLEDLMGATGATGDTILQAGEDTADFAEQWQIFKNKALVAVEPIATRVFTLIGDGMAWLNTSGGPILKNFGDRFREVFTRVQPAIEGARRALEVIIAWVQERMPVIRDTVRDVFGTVQGIIETAVTVISALWDTFGGTLMSTIGAALGNVVQILGGAFEIVRGIFKTFSAIFQGDWGKAWDGIKMILRGALDVLVGIIKLQLNVIKGAFGLAWDAVKGVASKAWAGIKSLVVTGVDDVVSAIKSIPGKLTGKGSELLSKMKSAGADLMGKFFEGLKSMGSLGVTVARNLIGGIVGALNSAIQKVNESIPNKIAIPGLPDIDLPDNPFPMISVPAMAKGGIVTKPTLALIGEAGPEAVVPLGRRGTPALPSQAPVVININGALDPLAVARQVETMLRKLERLTGRQLLATVG